MVFASLPFVHAVYLTVCGFTPYCLRVYSCQTSSHFNRRSPTSLLYLSLRLLASGDIDRVSKPRPNEVSLPAQSLVLYTTTLAVRFIPESLGKRPPSRGTADLALAHSRDLQ